MIYWTGVRSIEFRYERKYGNGEFMRLWLKGAIDDLCKAKLTIARFP